MNMIIHKIFYWVIMIFCIVIAILCCTSCMSEEYKQRLQNEGYKQRLQKVQNNCELVDITFNGETHEYIKWVHASGNSTRGSLSHWAGCKYCKEKSYHNVNQDDWLYN